MSTDEDSSSVGSPLLPSTPTPPPQLPAVERPGRGGGRHIPDLLRHQHSFEARYSSLIQKQIWENSINKDVLERQLNAYFPFSRSASLTKDALDALNQSKLSAVASTSTSAPGTSNLKSKSMGTTPKKRLEKLDRNCLEKLETIDVADQERQSAKKKPL